MKRSVRGGSTATNAGYTLIELLIVIAIIVILAGGILPLTSTLFGSLERQETRREAVEFVRDEMALLRGGARTLEVGIHPASSESLECYPIAETRVVEIREGPQTSLREIRIRMVSGKDESREQVEYVTLVAVSVEELNL